MKEFLSDKNVEYTEYNVDENKEALQEMMDISHHTIIPTVVVGDEVVLGFDAEKLSHCLQV